MKRIMYAAVLAVSLCAVGPVLAQPGQRPGSRPRGPEGQDNRKLEAELDKARAQIKELEGKLRAKEQGEARRRPGPDDKRDEARRGPDQGGPDRRGPGMGGPDRRGPGQEGRDRGNFDRRGPEREGRDRGNFDRRGPEREGRDRGNFDRRGPERGDRDRFGPPGRRGDMAHRRGPGGSSRHGRFGPPQRSGEERGFRRGPGGRGFPGQQGRFGGFQRGPGGRGDLERRLDRLSRELEQLRRELRHAHR